jgi:hypothetical protein
MAHFKGEVSFTANLSCVQTLYTGYNLPPPRGNSAS